MPAIKFWGCLPRGVVAGVTWFDWFPRLGLTDRALRVSGLLSDYFWWVVGAAFVLLPLFSFFPFWPFSTELIGAFYWLWFPYTCVFSVGSSVRFGLLLLQIVHLHHSVQGTPSWKHSQYPLLHPDRLHVQPLRCCNLSEFISSFFLKASGSRFRISAFAASIRSSCPDKLQQLEQPHSGVQWVPLAKHSQ